MTNELHMRGFRPDLEVRSSGDGRTIFGIAVPYNAPTRITDNLVEQFARSAFNHQIARPSRVKYAREHMQLGGTLIGTLTMMRDDAAGLYVEMRAAKTPVGDETLELVRAGALPDLSIAFREKQNRRLAGGVTERVTADLVEVASVMTGAYGELAVATGVRSANMFGGGAVPPDMDLLMQAEQYLVGLPALPDNELAIRQLRLGTFI